MQNETNYNNTDQPTSTPSYQGYSNSSLYDTSASATSDYGKFMFGMFTGAMAGAAAVLLMDKATRSNVASGAVAVKDMTMDMARDLKNNPQGFVDKIQEKSQVVSSIAQEASRSIQQIADKAMEAKEYSMQAVNVASQAMDDVKDVASSATQKVSAERKDMASSSSSSTTGSNVDRRDEHAKTDKSPDGTMTS
jgi:gas vesicle protein